MAQLRDTVHMMRFDGGSGYIAISRMDRTVIAHGTNPALEGKVSTATDGTGRSLTSIESTCCEQRRWRGRLCLPRPGQSQPQPKVAYVTRFTPWNVIVLSGAYTDIRCHVQATLTRLSNGGLSAADTDDWLAVNRHIGKISSPA